MQLALTRRSSTNLDFRLKIKITTLYYWISKTSTEKEGIGTNIIFWNNLKIIQMITNPEREMKIKLWKYELTKSIKDICLNLKRDKSLRHDFSKIRK